MNRLIDRLHTFHIPVMGTGFTIDTPVRVARYGISSVISLVDDHLIEAMRRHHSKESGESYEPIGRMEPNSRSRRITAYLDLLSRIIDRQMQALQASDFEKGSEITRYFEWLPENSRLKADYRRVLEIRNLALRRAGQEALRRRVRPGSIDVNIMTKADGRAQKTPGMESVTDSDASAALRGYAQSTLSSSVVFSAGLNPRLFDYATEFPDFFEQDGAAPKKKIILKVSDFRSAHIQAKFLAKKGLWVSEYRVESGLNCGGHAFPTCGKLIGPILQEFSSKKSDLLKELFVIYTEALKKTGRYVPSEPLPVQLSAQGGVGTGAEHQFLLDHFEVDSVGWGTPFLLVPEATHVDDETLARLVRAGEEDVTLSRISPLGVPFYTLKDSISEETRRKRIHNEKPGSPCLNGYLAYDTEFGEPLCTASSRYQSLKIQKIRSIETDPARCMEAVERVTDKACICRHLSDGAFMKLGLEEAKQSSLPAICPGPNLAYFSRIAGLGEMISHIYGRTNILNTEISRPHVFLKELKLYLSYFKNAFEKSGAVPNKKEADYYSEFAKNLKEGIDYYRGLAAHLYEETAAARQEFLERLEVLKIELDDLRRKWNGTAAVA